MYIFKLYAAENTQLLDNRQQHAELFTQDMNT